MSKIAFIGTGVMGKSIAGHLLSAGHGLNVYNRTANKAEELLRRGASWHDTPASAAAVSEFVFTIVGTPNDVEEVYFGEEGVFAGIQPGGAVIDMTTSTPALAEKIAEFAANKDCGALDGPVSGGDKGAYEGTLSIMLGGDRKTYERVLPLLELMGENIVYQGVAGSGQRCKICNQIVVAMNMLGVCESIAYAEKSGLDPKTVLQSISAGAAGSWALTNLAPKILERDFSPGFYVKHIIKDLSIALDSADNLGLSLDGVKLVRNLYEKLAAKGKEFEGTQALYRLWE